MAKSGVKKVRIDELLVSRGLAESLEKARALVMAGQVLVADQRVAKASQPCDPAASIRIKGVQPYVSRGGEKLAGALADFGLTEKVRGGIALDVGASTGGFTDCLLQLGAQKVIALDVGTNQLAWSLRTDPRVTAIEQTDARELNSEWVKDVDWVVADISFQSLARLVPVLLEKLPKHPIHFLLLVKPQFELPRELIPTGGVVTDPDLQQQAVERVRQSFVDLGHAGGEAKPSRVLGRTGNQEYFFYLRT